MIKPEELRIGNWLKNNNDISEIYDPYHKICGKDIYDLCENPSHPAFEKVKYIPLTPEILEKAGFNLLDRWAEKDEFILLKIDGNYSYFYSSKSDKRAIVKYVHQLQNLYFDLTGTELEITL